MTEFHDPAFAQWREVETSCDLDVMDASTNRPAKCPDMTMNPMDLPPGEKMPDEGKLNFLLTLIRNFALPGLDERINGEEDTVIVEAVKVTYMAHSQETEPPILSDVRRTLETMSQFSDGHSMTQAQRDMARSIAGRLRPFLSDSRWGQVLDSQSTYNSDWDLRQAQIRQLDQMEGRDTTHSLSDQEDRA